MAVQYTLTVEDYSESRVASGFGRRWLGNGTLALIGLEACLLGLRDWQSGDSTTPDHLTLLPVLGMLLGFILIVLGNARQIKKGRDIGNAAVWILRAVAVAGVAAGVWMRSLGSQTQIDWAWCVVGGASATILWSILRAKRTDKQLWDGMRDQQRPKQLEWDENGIVLSDVVSRCQWHWDAFVGSVQTRNLILLKTNRFGMVIVPRRAFPDLQAAEEFVSLVKRSVVPPSGGFPIRPCPPPLGEADLPVAKLNNTGDAAQALTPSPPTA
jgi:hypothetical protein